MDVEERCTRCRGPLRGDGAPCPCGEHAAGGGFSTATAAAVLLGLALSGCGGSTSTPEPTYGITTLDTADTGDSDS